MNYTLNHWQMDIMNIVIVVLQSSIAQVGWKLVSFCSADCLQPQSDMAMVDVYGLGLGSVVTIM